MDKHLCYEIVRHESGKPDYMDKVVTADTCLNKDDAVKITNVLNDILRNEPVKYYWRLRDVNISE